ncbi:hypothetical protein BH18ACT12_BH18ACT12_07880 [soil metagenome]
MGLAAALAAATIAVTPASFLQSHQGADGSFAEANGTGSPELTAWAALGLRASRASTGNALSYLASHEGEVTTPTSIALVALAQSALGRGPDALLARLPVRPRAVNAAVWHILALRQARRRVARTLVTYVLRSQARNGGFSWSRGLQPDSNDTAFAIQALRSAGVRGKPVLRAVAYLRGFQRKDGGFELARGRGSDAQSTAVAIQGFVAARVKPPAGAFRYLAALRRADGSYRYSARYAATPVWVTSQVLPALARKALPLR